MPDVQVSCATRLVSYTFFVEVSWPYVRGIS